MADIKKGSFADQLTTRMVPYMEEATKSVIERSREQMDKYFESVKPFDMSVGQLRDLIDGINSTLESTVTKLPSGADSKRYRLKDIIECISEGKEDFNKFIADFNTWRDELPEPSDDSHLSDIEQTLKEVKDIVSDNNAKLDTLSQVPEDEPEEIEDTEDPQEVEPEPQPITEVDSPDDKPTKVIEEVFRRKDKVDLERSNKLFKAIKDNSTKDLLDKLGIFIMLGLGIFTYWDKIKSWVGNLLANLGNSMFESGIPVVKGMGKLIATAGYELLGVDNKDRPDYALRGWDTASSVIAQDLGLRSTVNEEDIFNAVKDLSPTQAAALAEKIEKGYGSAHVISGVDKVIYQDLQNRVSGVGKYAEYDSDKETARGNAVNLDYQKASAESGSRDYSKENQEQLNKVFLSREVPKVKEEFALKTGINLDEVTYLTVDQAEIYNELLEARKSNFENTMSSGDMVVDVPDDIGEWDPHRTLVPPLERPKKDPIVLVTNQTVIHAPTVNISDNELTRY